MPVLRLAGESAAAARAFATWPVFSRTSFKMLLGLRRQGVTVTTLLDVGANKGQFTVAAHQLLKPAHIHAFEPHPEMVDRLQKLAPRLRGVTIHPIAVGDKGGEATLHINSHVQASSLLRVSTYHLRAFPRFREVGEVTVPVRRLDECIDPNALTGPVMLKIDTQGFEIPVLEGATGILDRVDMIVVEASFAPMYEGESTFREILTALEDRGFRFVRPVGALTDPRTKAYLQLDGLFVRVQRPDG